MPSIRCAPEAWCADMAETKTADATMDAFAIASTAHVDALTARAALERLTTLVVQGEIDTRAEADVDAFVCFADGIGARIDGVAEALDDLAHRIAEAE